MAIKKELKDPKDVPNPAEQNVAAELMEAGRPATDPDKQRAFGGPDFAVIPEDLPGREARKARAEEADAARTKEAEEMRKKEEERDRARGRKA